MKILTITALYPPHHLGGYDIRCSEVLEILKERGHKVRVLTSAYGSRHHEHDDNNDVWRYLHLDPPEGLAQRILSDIQDLQFIRRQIKAFQPDIIHLFHTAQLTRTIFPFLANQPIPIVYDEGGVGLISAWNKHGRWINFCESPSKSALRSDVKRILCKVISVMSGGVLPVRWAWPYKMHIYYNSAFSLARHRKAGVQVDGAEVIYSGIDISRFTYRQRNELNQAIQILVPGRIHPEKGLDDAIEAVALLKQKLPDREFRLDLAGPVQDLAYLTTLQSQIQKHLLASQVRFMGLLPHDEMVKSYHEADFCLLLTRIPESFSRVPLEAMACGIPLITTCTGGGAEVVHDGQNGFAVPVNSPAMIAAIIEKLIRSPELYRAITVQARKEFEERFTLERSVNQIEQLLMKTLNTCL